MNSMDNIFKRKLYDHKVPVKAGLWDRIEQGLEAPIPASPKSNYKLKWTLGIFILLFISTCAYVATDNPLKEFLTSKQLNNPFPQSASIVPAIKNEAERDQGDEASIHDSSNTPQKDEALEIIAEEQIKKQIQTPTNNKSNTTKDFQAQATIETEQNIAMVNEPLAEVSKAEEIIEKELVPPAGTRSSMESMAQLNSLTSKNVGSFKNKKLKIRLFKNQTECPDFGQHSSLRFALEPYVASDYAARLLESRSSEMEIYRRQRDNSENSMYSFAAGLRGSMMFGSGFNVKAGLVYTQINEKFTFEDPNASQIRTIITIDTVWVNGIPEVTIDTSSYQIGGSRFIQTYNKYKMIDIPLIVGYEVDMGKYNISINAGAYLNLKFSQKGRFLAPDGSLATFTTGSGNYTAFKNGIGLSLYGSIAIYYELTNRMDLMIEPRIRYYLDDFTLDSYSLKQSYVTTGLITGLRFKF